MKQTTRNVGSLSASPMAFVGAGVMGEAMIRGLLARNLLPPGLITATHPRPERLETLAAQFHIQTAQDNRAAAAGADIVVLSVKPQVLARVLRELRGAVGPNTTILSVVAGVPIGVIVDALRHPVVARCMPNTPAQIGEGMTVWTATPQVGSEQRGQIRAILAALGEQLEVQDERYMDMATAVSGTGPTYVFLLMEALIDAAVHLGFSRVDARALVLHTVRGAALFAGRSSLHPAELRSLVTSPGGTSAAAIYQLEKGGMRTVVSKAVWAAFQRSVALGREARAARETAEDGPAAEGGSPAPPMRSPGSVLTLP